MRHTLNGKEITSDFLDSLEANNYFGNSDESEDIRGAWEDLVEDWPWWKDISDAQSDFFLNEAIEMVYHHTLESIGSSAVASAYEHNPNIRFRQVTRSLKEFSLMGDFNPITSDGHEFDNEVILYQDNTEFGHYFATTNGNPIFEWDFRGLGCSTLQDAIELVQTL